MTRGLMKTASSIAVAAAAGLFATSAMAADLGGNCCADLEERVAELEATTARKGNRKVSLTVYGRITTGILWHDSDEEDAYRSEKLTVRQNNASPTVFGFRGEAQIRPELTAGYWMEIWVQEDTGTSSKDGAFTIRQNNVYLDSQQLGRLTLGQASQTTDGLFEINLANVIRTPGSGNEEIGNFLGAAFNTTFADVFDGGRAQGIYYRTPTLAGFVLGAGYSHGTEKAGEVDTSETWDVALKYAGEFNGVRIAAGIGYRETVDDDMLARTPIDDQTWLGSASIMHMPTGLFLSGGYADTDSEYEERQRRGYWLMAGIEKNWFGYGNTTIFGEYGAVDFDHEVAGATPTTVGPWTVGWTADPTADRLDGHFWGLGLVQTIDSAATDLYINFRRYELDSTTTGYDYLAVCGFFCLQPDTQDVKAGSRDATVIQGGMRIQF